MALLLDGTEGPPVGQGAQTNSTATWTQPCHKHRIHNSAKPVINTAQEMTPTELANHEAYAQHLKQKETKGRRTKAAWENNGAVAWPKHE